MSNYLYLILNLGSISIPLLYSVLEKKIHFIKYAKIVFISIFLVAVPFIIWDAVFTKHGVWGFNENYHLPFKIFKMPIEEWMFFFCIPYACLFTHEMLKYYLPSLKLSKPVTIIISSILIIVTFWLLIFNLDKSYTTVNFLLFLTIMLYSLKKHLITLQEYFLSFLVILIPFFIVNGILTGSFIDNPVVWYNNSENINVRLFTIPLEDVFYAFNLLFSIQLIFNFFKTKIYGNQ
ncbi:lycopene cyclase domain-containing protein [uncultured Tenacibaculum sp.]|uniref:lycopene cyclase domain-containing protein n=1 Tax=uncultured Tenacibaculum sp. TaxID=174713 RepID=UPI002619B402|nr:lycopene cyclase domain-containing protein [uncultured Tenacibaculum sp.]